MTLMVDRCPVTPSWSRELHRPQSRSNIARASRGSSGACACSQFENHVRAVLDWPLGSTAMVAPAAAMVNLLGYSDGPGVPRGLTDALRVPGVHVHV